MFFLFFWGVSDGDPRGEQQQELFVRGANASTCSLLHDGSLMFPFRLLLGFHSSSQQVSFYLSKRSSKNGTFIQGCYRPWNSLKNHGISVVGINER